MSIINTTTNRCAMFLYYDREGKVDDYVIYLLEGLKPHIEKLLVVCNGTLTEEGTKKLEAVADDLLFRANSGFDVGGYREGLFYYGFQELQKYDEVILLNYTFFGPLYPFSEMFDAMNQRDVDFWGITRHYKVDPDPYGANRYGYLPEHIQSYFLVLRNSFFMSDDYKEFIFNLKNPSSYIESICDYETIFAKHFEDLGYKWDTYMDTSEYEGYAYCPVMFYIKDMIERKRCPIIKRRSFFTDYQDYMLNTCGEPSIDAYEYICENVDYDTDLIWDNILRLENLTEISRVMHFNYILPTYASCQERIDGKTAVFVLIESIRHKNNYRRYFEAVPEEADVYLVGKKDDCAEIKKEFFPSRSKVEIVESAENYVRKLKKVLGIAKGNYEYICIANMRNVEHMKPYSNELSWQYSDWENILGSKHMVRNIAETFQANKRLGMLVPPVPQYGELFAVMADGWMGRFESTVELLKQAGISLNIKKQDEPLSPIGGSFWLRADEKVIETICKLGDDQTEEVCLALPFAAQYAGYYTGTAYSDKYSAIEMTNQDYMMRETNKAVFDTYGPNYHTIVLDRIRKGEVLQEPAPHIIPVPNAQKAKIKKALKKYLPEKTYQIGKKVYFKIRRR